MCNHKRIIYIFLIIFCFTISISKIKAEEIPPSNDETPTNTEENINEDNITNEEKAKTIVDNILEENEITEELDINKDNKLNINDATTIIAGDNTPDEEELEDNLSIELTKDKEEVYINDEVNIELSIKGFNKNEINGLEGTINYNKDKLELINLDDTNQSIKYGGINDNGKFTYILDNYNKEDSLLTFKFKTLEEGYGYITIDELLLSYNGLEYHQNEEKTSLILKINKPKEDRKENNNNSNNNIINTGTKTNTNKATINKTPAKVLVKEYTPYAITDTGKKITITYINLSNDNTIKELIIKNYKIDFSPNKLEYDLKVDADTKKLDITVILNDDKADYEIKGNNNFKVGTNKVNIIVTAEDGSEKKYIINVDKPKKEKESNSAKYVIIVLLILIIIGLIYVIFKEDDDD